MSCSKRMNRRHFIKSSSIVATAASLGIIGCSKTGVEPSHESPYTKHPIGSGNAPGTGPITLTSRGNLLPTRPLGETGMNVSLLSFGGGSQFMKNPNGKWEPLLQRAIDMGVNYFDTCEDYGDNTMMSEERYGELLTPIRDQVYIVTKFNARNNDGKRHTSIMMNQVETSLKRLKTDYLDVLMIHDVNNNDSVSNIADTVYPKMRELKEQGVAKHIGFSSMSSPVRARELIRNFDFDVCMLAINPTTYGNYETVTVPQATSKNMGVMAMKVMRDVVNETINGKKVTADELMHWALDLNGVSGAVIGSYGMDIMETNYDITMTFQPSSVEKRWGYLEHHLRGYGSPRTLCWQHPHYYDGMRRA